jgi:hypothetical protein
MAIATRTGLALPESSRGHVMRPCQARMPASRPCSHLLAAEATEPANRLLEMPFRLAASRQPAPKRSVVRKIGGEMSENLKIGQVRRVAS